MPSKTADNIALVCGGFCGPKVLKNPLLFPSINPKFAFLGTLDCLFQLDIPIFKSNTPNTNHKPHFDKTPQSNVFCIYQMLLDAFDDANVDIESLQTLINIIWGRQWEDLHSRGEHEGDAFRVGMGIPEWKT
uniref:Uncharacterized protein n=1 Tax=Panagrellus redivivus TaxID=6233 RepID=A0A7E4UW58_PANRE